MFSYKETCGATIEVRNNGYLTSPGYPYNHQHTHYNCTWILQNPEPDGRVTLTFTNLHSTASENCSHHFLELRAGDSLDSQLIDRYCGTRLPATVTSNGNGFFILAQDMAIFRLVYSPSSSACGGELEATEGTINSPWFPDSYPPSTDCQWTIRAAPGNRIQFSFRFFELEESDFCSGDFVEIRSSGSDGPLLGRFCGSRLNFAANSTSEAEVLWILFRSDEEGTERGFQAEYALEHGIHLEGTSGEIGSPLYPNMNYLDGDYGWTITVPFGSIVSIAFSALDLENYSESCGNYIQVHDGPDPTGNSLRKICGRQISENPILTTSDVAHVHFVSEGFLGARWLLSWNAANESYVATPETPTVIPGRECGGEQYVNSSSFAIVQSPNYPGSYYSDQNCTWFLMTLPTRHLVLNFTELNIEGYGDCYADALEVYDGETTGGSSWSMIRKLCGRLINQTISANSSLVKLFFTTDGSVVHSGFQINATEECGSRLYGTSGVLRTEDALVTNGQTEICEWLIQVRRGRTIEIKFDEFNVPSNGLCSTQYIQLINGGYNESPYLGDSKYCGQNIPVVPASTSNRVRIRVRRQRTDPWRESEPTPTFVLRYKELSLGCGGRLNLDRNTPSTDLTSPGYPRPPPHDVECSWVIMSPTGTSIGFHLDVLTLNTTNCHLWNQPSDYVDVFDGGTDHSSRLAHLCLNETNSFHTTSNIMLVRFIVGHDNEHSLFKASVSIGKCGGIIRENVELTSPGYPQNYEDNLECEWILQRENLLWTVYIYEMKLQQSPNCTNDAMEIREGDRTGALVGRYCGEMKDVEIPASGNPNLYIKFKSDASINDKGFRLYVQPRYYHSQITGCNNYLETPSGVITSPNYPDAVTERAWCHWRISAPSGRRVTVTFTEFNLPADVTGKCLQGLQVDNPLLSIHEGLICGTTLPEPIQSVSNDLYMSMSLSMLASGEGFRAEYHTDTEAFCGGDLPLPSGTFQLPSLSLSSYRIVSRLYCPWRTTEYQGRTNGTLVIQFNELVLGNSTDNCETSNFHGSHEAYYEGYRYWSFNLCGNYSGTTLRQYSPFLQVNLGLSIFKESFNIRLNASYYVNDCGGYQLSPATISSPGFPNEYPINMDCVWILGAIAGGQINLTIIDWGFEGDCNTDYLLIRNGPEPTAPVIAKYCNGNSGTDQPRSLISMGNTVLVEFHTDAQGHGKGFNVTTQAIQQGCGGIFSSTSETIASPGYPGPYPSSVECQWQIILPSEYSVNMTFQSRFDIQQSQDCSKDYLLVEERWENDWRTINRLCGYQRPDTIISNTSKVQLTFRSDNKTNADGFQLSYTPACSSILTEGHGILTSPGFPGPYSNSLLCQYLIQNPDVDRSYISLEFTNFTLESSDSCSFDKVMAYAGNSTSSPLLGTFCGSNLPPVLVSRGSMLLVFTTDGSVTLNGFRAEYGISGCGGSLTRPFGVFHSPNYPMSYPANVYCVWNITVETDMVLELKFLTFELEQGSCTWDYVFVTDTDGTELDRFCSSPPIIKSSGNSLLVTFRTDSSYQMKGFRAAYRTTLGEKQGCGGLITSPSGTIQSPDVNEDGMYETWVDCIWRIIGDDDKILSVTFDVFELEEGSGNQSYPCPYDYVQILDGLTNNSPLVDNYCGETIPSNLMATSNRLWVHFHSDDVNVKRGFQLEFSSLPLVCGGRLKVLKDWQSLSSPGFPSSFQAGLRCQWTFDLNNTRDRLEIHIVSFDIKCGSSYLDLFQYMVLESNWEDSGLGRPHRLCGDIRYHEIMATRSLTMLLVTGTESDPTATGTGFSIQYRIANCSRTYTNGHGYIFSPSYPESHPMDRQCNMTILAPEGYTISLYFMYFVIAVPDRYRYENREIEGVMDQRCRSYLKVFDGLNSSSPVLDTLCGYSVSRPIFSTSNQMYIELNRTDSDATKYAIAYTVTDRGRGCGGTIIGVNGSLTSPFYPTPYNESATCYWTVGVPGKHTLTLDFYSTTLPYSSTCDTNYFEVFDGNVETERLRITRLCRQEPIVPIISQGNMLLVKMVSSENNTGIGFRAFFHMNDIAITKTNSIVFNQPQPVPSATEAGVLEFDRVDYIIEN